MLGDVINNSSTHNTAGTLQSKQCACFLFLSVHFRTPLYQNRTLIERRSRHKFS